MFAKIWEKIIVKIHIVILKMKLKDLFKYENESINEFRILGNFKGSIVEIKK